MSQAVRALLLALLVFAIGCAGGNGNTDILNTAGTDKTKGDNILRPDNILGPDHATKPDNILGPDHVIGPDHILGPNNVILPNYATVGGNIILPAGVILPNNILMPSNILMPNGLITPKFMAATAPEGAKVALILLDKKGAFKKLIAETNIGKGGVFSFKVPEEYRKGPLSVVLGKPEHPVLRSLVTKSKGVEVSLASELAFVTLITVILPKNPDALNVETFDDTRELMDDVSSYFAKKDDKASGSIEDVLATLLEASVGDNADAAFIDILEGSIELDDEELQDLFADAGALPLPVLDEELPPSDTPLLAAKPEPISNLTSATFTFTASANTTFTCKLDTGAEAACVSGITHKNLSQGSHTFTVYATDKGAKPSTPVSYTWVVDNIPPDTEISSGPDLLTDATSASFSFDSDEDGVTFLCFLNGDPVEPPCEPKKVYVIPHVFEQKHTFSVYAVDRAGNKDDTPATLQWTVDFDFDNDGVSNKLDSQELDKFYCADLDNDRCDECSSGVMTSPYEDGIDTDKDAVCDASDTDDDNDTILDASDDSPTNRLACADADADGCDECASGVLVLTSIDGADYDNDGLCDVGDIDDDNDGLSDSVETNTSIWVSTQNTGSDPFDSDSDGDGVSDGDEGNGSRNPNVRGWTNVIDGPWSGFSKGYQVVELSDGSVVVAGRTYQNNDPRGWVVKIDPTGQQEWEYVDVSGDSSAFYTVGVSSNGSIVAGGTTQDEQGDDYDFYLVELDEDGYVIRSTSWDGESSKNDWISKIQIGNDDSIWGVGTTRSGGGMIARTYYFEILWAWNGVHMSSATDDGGGGTGLAVQSNGGHMVTAGKFVIPFDSNGVGSASIKYDDVSTSLQIYGISAVDDFFVAVGSTGGMLYNAVLLKLDASGDRIWSQTYGTVPLPGNGDGESGYIDVAACVEGTSDGGFLVAGQKGTSNNSNFWVTKTNSIGESLWEINLPTDDPDHLNVSSAAAWVIETSDGGLAATGNDGYDLIVIKSDHQP